MKKIKQFKIRQIDDEYMLIPCHETAEEMKDVMTMSETAAYIYQMIDQCPDIETLTQAVSQHYHVDADMIRSDITNILNQFSSIGLITL